MRKIIAVLLLCLVAFAGMAQNARHKTRTKHKTAKHKNSKTAILPSWAAAHNYDATAQVYFPDYYTFYDPQRGGYTYWDKGKWIFTPSVPPYMKNADLDKSRVKILKGLSLDLHPELDYPHYMELYPPAPNGNTLVPVPIPGNPGQ